MFGLFRKGESQKVVDRVWLTSDAKWKACMAMHKANHACLFVAWFEESAQHLRELLGTDVPVITVQEANRERISGKMLIMIEHYPLAETEQDFFRQLQVKEVPVLSALDEPLFMHFGGERLIEMMKKLGIQENEILGHSMISSSIRNAQKKIAALVRSEKKAASQQEWFALNVPRMIKRP